MTNNEFQGNPESGIDRFLNESNGIELPSDQAPAKPTYEELTSEVKRLESLLSMVTQSRDSYQSLYSELTDTVEKAGEAFREVLAGDMDPENTISEFSEVIDLLGWELNREVEIEVTVTWRGTVNLPYGTDVSDLEADDFYDLPTYLHHSDVTGSLDWYTGDVTER